MKRFVPLTLALVLVGAAPVRAETRVGVHIDIGNAPPPPVVVVREQPRVVMVPENRVYVVDDDRFQDDCFQYGVWWYIHRDGWWYRARSWRGPFTVVETRYVPANVMRVPPRYWRHPHGGPPGQMKRRDVVVVKEKHGRGHGHDRGHGRDD